MTNSNYISPTSLLFCRYKMNVYESSQIIEEWLYENPQESSSSLSQLILNEKIIVKNDRLYRLPKLSLSEAIDLKLEIQGRYGVEIKDRRYRLKVYRQCFIGSELVAWFLENKVVPLAEAICLGQNLVEHKIISHVCNEHQFKNEFLFYHFLS